jgi:hypothetical protein
MSTVLTNDDSELADLYQFRTEAGWIEVRKGLSKYLIGWMLLLGGPLVSAFLVLLLFLTLPGNAKARVQHLGFEILCWVCLTILAVCWIFGWGKIVVGQWKCLKHVPDRCGAKWLVFCSLTCALMGPALSKLSGWAGMKRAPTFRRGPEGLKQIQFESGMNFKLLASLIIMLTSFALFMLFLRAVARCFRDSGRVAHVTIFLLICALHSGWGLYMIFVDHDQLLKPKNLLLLLGGSVICFFWHLYLVLSIRMCVSRGMEMMRAPLDNL